METLARPLRPLLWVASSKRDYATFPAAVQDAFGFALFLAQQGQHPPIAKLMKGFGGGVVELIEDHRGGTYRAVYREAYRRRVRATCVQEEVEARRGNAADRYRRDTPPAEGCRGRLRPAIRDGRQAVKQRSVIAEGGENIFADLGLADAESISSKRRSSPRSSG
jgi:phage-related protein